VINNLIIKQSMLSIAVSSLLMSCATQKSNEISKVISETHINNFVKFHNKKIERLNFINGYGVIELNEKEDTLQGDCEFWILQPENASLRITKLGEIISWLGYTSQKPWIFEVKEKRMHLRKGADFSEYENYPPSVLKSILGLEKIPPRYKLTREFGIKFIPDQNKKKWEITYMLDPSFLYPVAVIVEGDRDFLVKVNMPKDSYIIVSEKSKSIFDSIKFPGYIEICDSVNKQLAVINLEYLTTNKLDQPLNAVFNLEKLTQSLIPEGAVK